MNLNCIHFIIMHTLKKGKYYFIAYANPKFVLVVVFLVKILYFMDGMYVNDAVAI
jgi:hypothetical protein